LQLSRAKIYLDHQATTPCDARVVEAMLPYFAEEFGNPASKTHGFGWNAERAVEAARGEVAALIGASAREIVFTSGATEANNLAIRGALVGQRLAGGRGDHVVTCKTEHRAVLDPCRALLREGFRVTEIGVDRAGHVALDELERALEPGTVLISLMLANNEIGVIQDLASIAALARARGVLLHSDAAQAAGKVPLDVRALGVDLVSLSAHKLYGPKGIGALYVRHRRPPLPLAPLIHGGGHERGLRSGTLPVPLCVGFGRACALAAELGPSEAERIRGLRERLLASLRSELPEVWLNGVPERRLPGNLSVAFPGVEAEALLLALPELALSTGSACTSARREPSHVLRALGMPHVLALGTIRIGLGRTTSEADVDEAARLIAAQVRRLRALSPTWKGPAG
jgi:cysteine desulfurase